MGAKLMHNNEQEHACLPLIYRGCPKMPYNTPAVDTCVNPGLAAYSDSCMGRTPRFIGIRADLSALAPACPICLAVSDSYSSASAFVPWLLLLQAHVKSPPSYLLGGLEQNAMPAMAPRPPRRQATMSAAGSIYTHAIQESSAEELVRADGLLVALFSSTPSLVLLCWVHLCDGLDLPLLWYDLSA
eukprot:1148502-Pelagomonas_calceolata.AAC.3